MKMKGLKDWGYSSDLDGMQISDTGVLASGIFSTAAFRAMNRAEWNRFVDKVTTLSILFVLAVICAAGLWRIGNF